MGGKGGGGGGSQFDGTTPQLGGTGINNGSQGVNNGKGGDGGAGTGGGGGGGAWQNTNGGAGGSGVVIIRYKYTKTETVQLEVNGLLKYNVDNGWLIDTAITDTIVSNTSLIAILQSQMIEVFAALTAKSINAVYEWATDNSGWKIIEPNKQIFLPNGNFQIRLRVINVFSNNAVLPFYIFAQDTKRSNGVVTNTYTTYTGSTDVILYSRQHTTATQHDLRIQIDDTEGFVSSFFDFTIANLGWLISQ